MMSQKRAHSPELVANPFIKKRNLEWNLDTDSSTQLQPGVISSSDDDSDDEFKQQEFSASGQPPPAKTPPRPRAASVEAGQAQIDHHVDYFSALLGRAAAASASRGGGVPRLPIDGYRQLYASSSGSPRGAHFVVHQHDHPVAGTHYDLRLQINKTSSASWAVMYGLPGDPNSRRLNRNATETRVHCLWNHLIETASPHTGSLLIWDTGTYTVLPRRSKHAPARDPDSQQSDRGGGGGASSSSSEGEEGEGRGRRRPTEQQKLAQAFQARKIRIRLDGSRLPTNYVLNLRLTKTEDAAGRAKSGRRPVRRRTRGRGRRGGRGGARGRGGRQPVMTSSDSSSSLSSDNDADDGDDDDDMVVAVNDPDLNPAANHHASDDDQQTMGGLPEAMEREIRELEDDEVRRTNAYPGAHNSIGSVHQRRWYLSLDREACGFVRRRKGDVGGGGGGDGLSSSSPGRRTTRSLHHQQQQKSFGSTGDDNKALIWIRDENAAEGVKAHNGKNDKRAPDGGGDGGDAVREKESYNYRSEASGLKDMQPPRLTFPFYVRGAPSERSVVTGRLGAEVLRDERVEGFVARKGWRPVLN